MSFVNTETKEGKMLNVAIEMIMYEGEYREIKPFDLVKLIEDKAKELFGEI